MIRTSKARLITAIAALALSIFVGIQATSLYKAGPTTEVRVIVPTGSGYGQTLALFRKTGALDREFPLRVLGRIMKIDRSVQPGLYRVAAGSTPLDVYRMIRDGVTVTVTVTVPEGFTLHEIARLVESAGLGKPDDFLRLAKDPALLAQAGLNAPSFEGFLFPDTYRFPAIHAPRDVLWAMYNRFLKVIEQEPIQHQLTRSGLTRLQVVTLASIVEKEAKLETERPLIAGVYLNRLKKGMRLESDPTILYGVRPLGAPIRKSEIRRSTPYNTYVITGLPPGPIANPGEASLRAVLFPARTDALFFVANPDGSHQFSATLAAHNRAVAERRRANRTGKSRYVRK